MLVCFSLHAACLSAQEDERAQFFEKRIRPLLIERCYECHSEKSDDLGGGLLLDSREGWEAGGELGPAIVPAKPDESLLMKAVRPGDDTLQMPPDDHLKETEIADLQQWIESGAFDPRRGDVTTRPQTEIDLEKGREFWAFIPPVAPDAGALDPESWTSRPSFRPENRVDVLMLRQWQEQGLVPSSPTDKRTLIRRITFDLIGLPPTADDIDRFLVDNSPNALDRLIDRLLASPAYGERWGRHWLGVARYADSNGMDENIAHGNAWRYRDWVVNAMNRDKSYAEFVREQLAGDLLPDSGNEQLENERTIATGFLSLGPKVLAEVDETKMEMDIIDEQVETVGRAMMGLTLGCARCHDHKFDPIRMDDYYAMAGIFKSTRTMEHFTKIAKWYEIDISTSAERAARQAATDKVTGHQAQIDKLIAQANQELQQRLADGQALPEKPEEHYTPEQQQQLAQLRKQLEQLQAAVPEIPTAMGVMDEAEPVNLPVHLRGSHLTLGEQVSRGVPEVLTSIDGTVEIPAGSSGRLELAQWLVAPDHPLTWRVMVNRVWGWHFGQGLVATTDNFGELGERPVNPQLLDWLASEFCSRGGSLKTLHRLLLTSATYGQSSLTHPENMRLDPENRYLWRANLRRLDAESIRDALLFVGGQLDRKMGGSLLHVGNREFLFDHTSKDETNYSSRRRALYLPVIRNHLYDQFALFDYSNASVVQSQRSATTVPSQALFMLNSQLVIDASKALTQRLDQEATESERTRLLYLLTVGREPTTEEVEMLTGLVAEFSQSTDDSNGPASTQRAWQLFAHTLLSSNEFLYLR